MGSGRKFFRVNPRCVSPENAPCRPPHRHPRRRRGRLLPPDRGRRESTLKPLRRAPPGTDRAEDPPSIGTGSPRIGDGFLADLPGWSMPFGAPWGCSADGGAQRNAVVSMRNLVGYLLGVSDDGQSGARSRDTMHHLGRNTAAIRKYYQLPSREWRGPVPPARQIKCVGALWKQRAARLVFKAEISCRRRMLAGEGGGFPARAPSRPFADAF